VSCVSGFFWRFLAFFAHQSSKSETGDDNQSDQEEERTQERLAKRFAKRARMQRLEAMYSESQEFSQQRLIDEDKNMKIELQSMKVRSTEGLDAFDIGAHLTFFVRMALFASAAYRPLGAHFPTKVLQTCS
jgi:catalase (peroxidase I)